MNWGEEGGQYYISQTCDQERFEARKVVFSWECLNIFATGCSSTLFGNGKKELDENYARNDELCQKLS